MKKVYSFRDLEFGFDISSRKWKFIAKREDKKFTFLYPANGLFNACKIAGHLSGGIKRHFSKTGELGLDNLSRKNIELVSE